MRISTRLYLSNRKRFPCLRRHDRDWENSRQLCKPETKSRVCITVENSPNLSSVYIRIMQTQEKRFLSLL